jgi:hypothetical protein
MRPARQAELGCVTGSAGFLFLGLAWQLQSFRAGHPFRRARHPPETVP